MLYKSIMTETTEITENSLGNIQTSSFSSEDTKGFQANKWFFTYHIKDNETFEIAFERLKPLTEFCDKYVWSEEYGKSNNTPHIQGAFILKNKIRYRAKTLQSNYFLNGVTLRKLKNWNAAFEYCIKENNKIYTNVKIPEPVKIISEDKLYKWQKKIIDYIQKEPDDREILWICGKQGCGKTQFIKYLVINFDAIILNGKPSDMKNGIIDYKSKNNDTPKLIVSNIGFDKDLSLLHYSGYEDIKDMCFYSGKYEGGMICGNNPHLLIFSNGKPITENVKFTLIQID